MKRFYLPLALALILSTVGLVQSTLAGDGSLRGWIGHRQAARYPWHGGYYNTTWGAPVAMVVPPNVKTQSHWGWGIGGTRTTPIRHQFSRAWPGPSQYDRGMFRHTPRWPSGTDQFGTHYIRAPW